MLFLGSVLYLGGNLIWAGFTAGFDIGWFYSRFSSGWDPAVCFTEDYVGQLDYLAAQATKWFQLLIHPKKKWLTTQGAENSQEGEILRVIFGAIEGEILGPSGGTP
ncbi:hypothetical protein U1Q18_014471 [Sarracenia purpurea var. burkii]